MNLKRRANAKYENDTVLIVQGFFYFNLPRQLLHFAMLTKRTISEIFHFMGECSILLTELGWSFYGEGTHSLTWEPNNMIGPRYGT